MDREYDCPMIDEGNGAGITGIRDERQITAVFCDTLAGDFLQPQLIYQGKTSACLPRHKFPSDWHVTCTPNHWLNEEKVKDYLDKTTIPCVKKLQ